MYGKEEGRLKNSDELYIQVIEKNRLFEYVENESQSQIELTPVFKDIAKYMERHFEEKKLLNINDLMTYIKKIDTTDIYIPNVFDAALYLEIYKDLKKNNINPLWHYLTSGLKEKRIAYIDQKYYVKAGKKKFSTEKKTIVFVTHESSATGAPLLGYSILDELNKR